MSLLILTGLSGAGKDSVAEALKAEGFVSAVPHTTRPMREGESEGNPYHFVDEEQYINMLENGEFIESNKYLTMFNGIEGWSHYGTSKASLSASGKLILTIGVQSALRTKEAIPDSILIYLDVPDATREQRAKLRGSFEQVEWDNRLSQDVNRRKNGEMPMNKMDAVIDNTEPLARTVNQVLLVLENLNKETK